MQPHYLQEFLTIAAIHFLAVASPGPDFAVVMRQSITFGKRAGIMTSLGIGCGVFVHVAYCVVGLGLIISKSIIAFNVVKFAGAAYLIIVGFKALTAKAPTIEEASLEAETIVPQVSTRRAFALGFLTNILNPKATLFFLSVFSVVVSPSTPTPILALYGLWMAIVGLVWFSSLSFLFSRNNVRALFTRIGHRFEQAMGTLLVALGLRLAFARVAD